MHCAVEQQQELNVPHAGKCHCGSAAVVGTLCNEHFCIKIEQKVQDTINRFSLFSLQDKIIVAYSGGKDSTVLLYILAKLGYCVEAITLNAYIGCYSKENVHNAMVFAKQLNIKLHHISFREEFGYSLCYLRSIIRQKGTELTSCAICGVLRRYLLNKHARQLGMAKIAFGHNLDDEAQSILMNLIKGSPEQLARMGPATGITEYFVQRVKPLYFVTEEEVIAYSKIKQFPVHYGACPCSTDSLRHFIRTILRDYSGIFPKAQENIVKTFLALKPVLKQETTKQIPSCSKCNEPSANKVCRACTLLSMAAT